MNRARRAEAGQLTNVVGQAPRRQHPASLRAEAERLYLVTLDALAGAQAGVLTHVDGDGEQTRQVSASAVARMIREARHGLDLLVKLSTASERDGTTPSGVNDQLDARIADALDAVARRALTAAPADVIDADVVEDVGEPVHAPRVGGAAAQADPPQGVVRATAPQSLDLRCAISRNCCPFWWGVGRS